MRGGIVGAHCIIYSRDAGADRAFLGKVLKLTGVDVGDGWLIFGLPPSEVAVHPDRRNDVHELFLMCDDVAAFVASMKRRRIRCEAVKTLPWGRLTRVALPGGGMLGVYEPRHARPEPMAAPKTGGRRSRRRAGTGNRGRRRS
jgi:hypothetical protein